MTRSRSPSASSSESSSNASDFDFDRDRTQGEPVLNERVMMFVANEVKRACATEALRARVAASDYVPTSEDVAFVARAREAFALAFDAKLPTLEDEVEKERERGKKGQRFGVASEASRARDAKLSGLPSDGWRRTRKRERVKLGKNDPEAQGRVETRKLLEDGAGLFQSPADPTKINREIRKNERQTAGKGWFDMKAVEYTPELRREMRMLKLRGAYDPKRFYKNADTTKLPTHFQIGTVVGGAADFYSARLAKRDQKQTLAEEILHDKDIERVRRDRFAKIQEKNAGSMGRKSKRRLGGRERGNSFHKKKKS